MKTLLDFKGTQGEFNIRPVDDNDFCFEIGESPTYAIAAIYVCKNASEAKANAKLFANSKKVLEALILVREHMTAHIPEHVFDKVEQAINNSL